jgi:metal-sulfur cluster biosynthetic enzyme
MTTTTTTASVIDALAEVYDPELDEPITRLGFVSSCEVSPGGDVEVVLRLPTPQCAPNFAFLMAADARKAVRRLPEVRDVSIRLEDHYTGDEINAALGRGDGFTGAFPGETVDDDLTALRELFLRKALVGRQSRLCESLLNNAAWTICHKTSATRNGAWSFAANSACQAIPTRPRSCSRTATLCKRRN